MLKWSVQPRAIVARMLLNICVAATANDDDDYTEADDNVIFMTLPICMNCF